MRRSPHHLDRLLDEQLAYYRARAPEYLETAFPVPHTAEELEQRVTDLGWQIRVRRSAVGPFFWGAGTLRDGC